MPILAIESSCDDLAVCAFEGPDRILAMQTASQTQTHSRFGGIVPEIASREHLASISEVVAAVLSSLSDPPNQKKLTFDAVAVTSKPGLVGSLLVGLNFAKGFALANQLPLIGVDHLEAHLLSAFLEPQKPSFPFLGLIVSGGHTHLYWVEGIGKRHLIGRTVDDAAGEAYDKVAKMFGLGYPGGPILDALAQNADAKRYRFSIPQVKRGKYLTSFSGLKTAVLERIQSEKILHALQTSLKNRSQEVIQESIRNSQTAKDLIASFQETIVQSLLRLLTQAAYDLGCKRWVIAGGVACNSRLREAFAQKAIEFGAELFIPKPLFCTDNAAMVAYVGHAYFEQKRYSDWTLNAQATGTS